MRHIFNVLCHIFVIFSVMLSDVALVSGQESHPVEPGQRGTGTAHSAVGRTLSGRHANVEVLH